MTRILETPRRLYGMTRGNGDTVTLVDDTGASLAVSMTDLVVAGACQSDDLVLARVLEVAGMPRVVGEVIAVGARDGPGLRSHLAEDPDADQLASWYGAAQRARSGTRGEPGH